MSKRKHGDGEDEDEVENVKQILNLPKKSKPLNPLSLVPKAPCDVDSLANAPYKVAKPLPPKSFAMYIVGRPGSGKTNLMVSMLMSKCPKYYRGYFDKIFLFSGSLQTLPRAMVRSKKTKNKGYKGIPPQQQFDHIDPCHIFDLIEHLRKGENYHNLFVIDDLIMELARCPQLTKMFFNRRHATHSEDKDNQGGLSIMVTSQKYNCLDLRFRQGLSHCIIFGTENESEKRAIRDELMQDLTKEEQDYVFRRVWPDLWDRKGRKHGFLFVDIYASKFEKYYDRFDLIEFQ